MINQILDSIKPVVKKSKQVRINEEKLKEICLKFNPDKIDYWTNELPYNYSKLDDLRRLNFIFVFNSINFCYWGNQNGQLNTKVNSFKGKKFGNLKNIDELTAFADYKIPQSLRKLGILEYSQDLSAKIDNKVKIAKGSEEEIEIRANTIWAVELMKKELKTKNPNITSMDIDSYLWLLGQNKSPDDKPYHLTETIYY